MKNFKVSILFLIIAMFLGVVTGCNQGSVNNSEGLDNTQKVNEESEEAAQTKRTDINIVALKGPTAMSMVELFDRQDKGETENNYNYNIVNSPDEAVAAVASGEANIVALPGNLAATLYNKTEGGIKAAAVNTLGVIYLASHEELNDVSQLAGKTIISSGKGATPEFALRYILEKHGINPDDDVNIEYKSEHTEVVQSLSSNPEAVISLPEPFLTVAKTNDENLKTVFSLSELWDDISQKEGSGSRMITGVIAVSTEFYENNPEELKIFLEEYEDSVDFVVENVDEAATLVGKYDIVPEAVAKEAIPNANIVCIRGEEMKSAYSSYLNVLYDQNAASVGGNLPDEEFYITE